jgi:hypothetical protein
LERAIAVMALARVRMVVFIGIEGW